MSTPKLREIWDGVDAGPVPLADLHAAGRRVRRRRRAALAAAVVAIVAGVGVVVPHAGDERATEPAGELPAAPQGSRWVGTGRVVVAVPDWWTVGETQCLEPVEDTVYVDGGAIADCADPPSRAEVREASTLAVLEGAYAESTVAQMRPVAEASGHQVLELPGCEGWLPGVCRHLVAVPDEDVVLAIAIADEADGDYEQIRDSLRILPDGLVTVPLAVRDGGGPFTPAWGLEPTFVGPLVRTLERAGLRVNRVVADMSQGDAGTITGLPEGSLLGVSPALGSVVEEGATVTVTVAGPRVS